jgi:hypothetical protein
VLLQDLPSIDQRASSVLQIQAEEYFKKISKRHKNTGKKPVKWDF